MRIRVLVALSAAASAAVSALVVAGPATADVRSTPRPSVPLAIGAGTAKCWFGACFTYVSGSQDVRGTGASTQMFQARPALDPKDLTNTHSLQELAVQSVDRSFIVEVGWTVDRTLNGDSNPHLFVYHWVNNKESCYNKCGFVQVSSPFKPGMTVTTGVAGSYGIAFSAGNWWIAYNGSWLGYFPGSLWGNRFTQFERVQVFGEVSSRGTQTCTDMGNGTLGSRAGSSWISSFSLQGTTAVPALTVFATSPTLYDQGQVTPTGFHLGGPGTGGC